MTYSKNQFLTLSLLILNASCFASSQVFAQLEDEEAIFYLQQATIEFPTHQHTNELSEDFISYVIRNSKNPFIVSTALSKMDLIRALQKQFNFECKIKAEDCMNSGSAHIDSEKNYSTALLLARQIGDPRLEIQALIGLGNAQVDSEKNYSKALQLARQYGELPAQAKALIGLGNAKVSGKENYTEALNIAQQLNDPTLQAQAYIGLGRVHHYQNSESFYLAALNVATSPKLKKEAKRGLEDIKRSQKRHFQD